MVFSTPPLPYHRQNRRRERPGARKRHALSRKESLASELADGVLLARDTSISFPSEHPRPSPLLRQNFDASWRRWKAREAEQRAHEHLKRSREMESVEMEQCRVFGGEVDDDVSLCANMLDVVRFLWGDVDYTDP
jgi:hypothetical protein